MLLEAAATRLEQLTPAVHLRAIWIALQLGRSAAIALIGRGHPLRDDALKIAAAR
jgi:hypothetical protein